MSAARRPTRPPWAGPPGLYRPGSTAIHRAPVALKLAALAVVSLTVLAVRGPLTVAGALVVVLAAAVWGRVPPRATARALLPVVVAAGVLGAYQWWARGPVVAAEVTGGLVVLVLGATVVTATTPSDRVLASLTRALGPLRRLGVRPESVALAVALMLRALPALLTVAAETRDAARARGLGRDPRALLVPFAVRTVARAHATGDALAARGLAD